MTNAASESSNTSHSTQSVDHFGSALTALVSVNLDEIGNLETLAQQVLEDPVALERLGDRVFELLKTEIRSQRERGRVYGGRLS